MAEPQTWRELLHDLIENMPERQRISQVSGINAITLQRWANNEGNPRLRNLHQLVSALPEHSAQLTRLIKQEYATFFELKPGNEEDLSQIPSYFYTSVMRAYTKTSPSLRFWSIGKLILQQAFQHLDPQRLGLVLTVIACTTPGEPAQKVRSLRILLGQGSTPWQGNWDRYPLFMGIESLCGYVVNNRRLITIQDTQSMSHSYYPLLPVEHARCVAVVPIQRGESIAGCFCACSTQPFYFTAERLELIQNYSQLLTVAFTQAEFYLSYNIDLALFPSQKQQAQHFSTFQQRLLDTMRSSARQEQPLSGQQASSLVMSQLEEELSQLAHKLV
ncbi:MAG TPA: GAF domain-containing protein [Ktedonobacteraceae bacterium]|nr:GAF domain-containing protein [Ktedonobacteraceae bacterium]